jgi:hypothetical protein
MPAPDDCSLVKRAIGATMLDPFTGHEVGRGTIAVGTTIDGAVEAIERAATRGDATVDVRTRYAAAIDLARVDVDTLRRALF